MPRNAAMLRLALALFLSISSMSAHADEVVLYGAGSLREALTVIAKDFTARTGIEVRTAFGPSGLMRGKIEKGDKVDLFASADMGHAVTLRQEGLAAAAMMFTRNRLCAFATPETGLTRANFADRLLDPAVRLGTSTPKADPAGDYTWAMFKLIDAQRPGAYAMLDAKARKVVGNSVPTDPSAADPVVAAFKIGEINAMIGYCSGTKRNRDAIPGIEVIEVPEAYSVGPEYGLAIMRTDNPAAVALAFAIQSPEGQATLESFGFAPMGLPASH
jgi:molybdenum ABC transporter molybdate-binding protein